MCVCVSVFICEFPTSVSYIAHPFSAYASPLPHLSLPYINIQLCVFPFFCSSSSYNSYPPPCPFSRLNSLLIDISLVSLSFKNPSSHFFPFPSALPPYIYPFPIHSLSFYPDSISQMVYLSLTFPVSHPPIPVPLIKLEDFDPGILPKRSTKCFSSICRYYATFFFLISFHFWHLVILYVL